MQVGILDVVISVTREWGEGNEPRKTAESTGRLPPTPTDQTAAREHSATALGEPPAEMPNMAVMSRVMLKEILLEVGLGCWYKWEIAHLRPHMSHPTPQTTAPTSRPMFWPSLRKGPLK